jgi:acyl carrier protein
MSEPSAAREVQDLIDPIRTFVASHFPLARKLAGPDEPLLESGIVDSLGILEIVNFLTQRFELDIEDDDLLPENFASVRSIAQFVHAKRANHTP